MIVGCYSLHLYCDTPGCRRASRHGRNTPDEYTGQTYRECKRAARKDGWTFRKGKCRCPDCGRAGKSFGKPEVA